MSGSYTKTMWLTAAVMAVLVAVVGGGFAGMTVAWAFIGVAGMFAVFAFTLDEEQ